MPIETPDGTAVVLSNTELDDFVRGYMRMLGEKKPSGSAGVVIRADVLLYLFRFYMSFKLLEDVIEGGIALVKERWPPGSYAALFSIERIRVVIDMVDDLRGGTPDITRLVDRPTIDLGFLPRAPLPPPPVGTEAEWREQALVQDRQVAEEELARGEAAHAPSPALFKQP